MDPLRKLHLPATKNYAGMVVNRGLRKQSDTYLSRVVYSCKFARFTPWKEQEGRRKRQKIKK